MHLPSPSCYIIATKGSYRIVLSPGYGYQLERAKGDGWVFVAQGSGGEMRRLLDCMAKG